MYWWCLTSFVNVVLYEAAHRLCHNLPQGFVMPYFEKTMRPSNGRVTLNDARRLAIHHRGINIHPVSRRLTFVAADGARNGPLNGLF